MYQNSLTTNEITLLAAIISAITSLVVWFLTQRFGPNYKKQIDALTDTLEKILQQHSAIAESLANVSAQGSSKWQPAARIESNPRENRLVLKSDVEFRIERIVLLTTNGAVFSEIPVKGLEGLASTGYSVPLPEKEITQFWNDSSGPRNGWATGTIKAEVSLGEHAVDVLVPFLAKQEFDIALRAWIRLTG